MSVIVLENLPPIVTGPFQVVNTNIFTNPTVFAQTDVLTFPILNQGVVNLADFGNILGATAVSLGNGYFLTAAHNYGDLDSGGYTFNPSSTPNLTEN